MAKKKIKKPLRVYKKGWDNLLDFTRYRMTRRAERLLDDIHIQVIGGDALDFAYLIFERIIDTGLRDHRATIKISTATGKHVELDVEMLLFGYKGLWADILMHPEYHPMLREVLKATAKRTKKTDKAIAKDIQRLLEPLMEELLQDLMKEPKSPIIGGFMDMKNQIRTKKQKITDGYESTPKDRRDLKALPAPKKDDSEDPDDE